MVQHLGQFFAGAPTTLTALVVGFLVVTPAHIVVHELGHAAAALRLTDGPVAVRVGTGEARLHLAAGRLVLMAGRVQFGRPGGFCAYNLFDASPRTRAVVAMCGPIVSFTSGILAVLLWVHTGHGLPHDLCWWMALIGIGDGIVNAIPFAFVDRAGHHLRTDGRLVLDSLRGRDQALIARVRSQAESSARSVPPPGR